MAKILMKGRHNTTIYEAIYDNSSVFVQYLNGLKAARHAQAVHLKLKSTHTIVPYVRRTAYCNLRFGMADCGLVLDY